MSQIFSFAEAERRGMLALARRAIFSFLMSNEHVSPPDEPYLRHCLCAFVTLKMRDELRGCIGCTEPIEPLGKTIVRCAVSAAVHDPRFPPVQQPELPLIDIEISVLSPFVQVRTPEEIEIGKHGILLTIGNRKGLLLPQVAVEYGWDIQAFLGYTCLKAGLPPNAWKIPGAVIQIFSAEVFGES